MALIKLEEPRVKVTERIREYPVLLNIDGSANIGGVIVAPTGPRLSYVTGPDDFLKKYTVDGNIPRNADITFLNAYYLSFSTGLVIARAMNTTAVGGILFVPEKIKVEYILLNVPNESFFGFAFGDYYYWCNGTNTSLKDFKDVASQIMTIEKDNGVAVEVPAYDNLSDTLSSFESTGKLINCSSLSDLATKICETRGGYDAKNCTWVESKWKDAVTYSSVTGGLTFVNQSIQEGELNKLLNVELYYDVEKPTEDMIAFESYPMKYKDGLALNKSTTLQLTLPNGDDNFSNSNFAFTLGTMAYYHGAIDKSKYADYSLIQLTSIDDLLTSINGMAGLAASWIGNVTDADNVAQLVIECSEGNELIHEFSDLDTGITISGGDADNYSTSSNWKSDYAFAIYPNNPQDSNKYVARISVDDGNLFYLTLSDGRETNGYTVSLDIDAVDQSGVNAFIENLNSYGIDFTIVTNPNAEVVTPKVEKAYSFGDSGLDLSASKSNSCMVNALYVLEDQEMYDIEYLSSFGYTNLNFIKNYTLVGRNNDWFTPVDIPYDRTNKNSIRGYFLNVDNHSNIIGIGPFDKNIGLTGWMFYLAPTSLYYTKVFNNRAARKEFAPVFDITNGVLDYTNPCYTLGKEERTELLNFKCPVNFVIYNQRNQVYYFNDNRTHQSALNIVSEEQNRRQVNKIKKDCKRLMQSFKGRLNTASTRMDVVSTLRYYFQTQIMNQEYKPNEYQIICDDSNNTVEVINANQLAVTVRVRLENAIKFVDVLVDVFPLGVDFAE